MGTNLKEFIMFLTGLPFKHFILFISQNFRKIMHHIIFIFTARGLDIPHIRTVINYDIARDIDTHTHRVGRTGRAGTKGHAYTLISSKDKEFAGHLVRNLEGANQFVPQALLDLAMQVNLL